LAQKKDLDRIIIEPSGLFLPEQIVASFKQPTLRSTLQLEPIYTVVDMAFLANARQQWPPFISRHLEFAAYIVVNKEAGISRENSKVVKQRLRRINKQAIQVSFSDAIENFETPEKQHVIQDQKLINGSHDIKYKLITENITFENTEELKLFFKKQHPGMLRAKGIVIIDSMKVFVNYTQNSLKTSNASSAQSTWLSCFYGPKFVKDDRSGS